MLELLTTCRPGTGRGALAPRGVRFAQAGLSLVELLVGIAVGLVIAAAGIAFLSINVQEQRALLLESRLMQDLRTAADIVARDLRRAGYWGAAADSTAAAASSAARANPYAAVGPTAAASDAVAFQFSRDASENAAVDANERFGFRLRNGVLEVQLGAANWQALTDPGALTITAFSVTPTVQEIDLSGACASACAASAGCVPRTSVRSFALRIAGSAVSNPLLLRSIRAEVRMRNDPVTGSCAA